MPVNKLKHTKFAKRSKSFQQISQEWENLQKLDIRAKSKAMKVIGHDIYNAYKMKETEPSQLLYYVKILQQINRIHDIPRFKIAVSKIMMLWLELSGNADAHIIKKISETIEIESARISIGDLIYIKEVMDSYADCKDDEYINIIKSGKNYIFDTGCDGKQAIQIRIIDSIEPVLTPKEYKCVVDCSETAMIQVPSGQLVIADPAFLNFEEYRMSIQIEPGNYKIAIFHFYIPSKIDSYYIVLCKCQLALNFDPSLALKIDPSG